MDITALGRPLAVSLIALLAAAPLPALAQTATDTTTEGAAMEGDAAGGGGEAQAAQSGSPGEVEEAAEAAAEGTEDPATATGEAASQQAGSDDPAAEVPPTQQRAISQDLTEAEMDPTGIQRETPGGLDGDTEAAEGDQPITEAIREADAPTMGVTDTEGTSQATIGTQPAPTQGQGAVQGGGQDDPLGRTVMLDIESFSQELYERGYRQGYVRGMMDARARMADEMQRAGERLGSQQQMQRAQPQPGQPQPGQRAERGSVVILPPGVSPEAFIERLQRGQ